MAKAAVQTLDTKVKSFWGRQSKSSIEGLNLLVECMEEFASQRNWDPLARFVTGARASGRDAKVRKVLMLAFGQSVKMKADAKHPAGTTFEISWGDGPFNLAGRNSFQEVLAQARADAKGWDSVAFMKLVNEKIVPVEKAVKPASDELKKKRAKDMIDKIKGWKDEGITLGEMIHLMQVMAAK